MEMQLKSEWIRVKELSTLMETDVVQFDMDDPSWKELIAGSKFLSGQLSGTAKKGKDRLARS